MGAPTAGSDPGKVRSFQTASIDTGLDGRAVRRYDIAFRRLVSSFLGRSVTNDFLRRDTTVPVTLTPSLCRVNLGISPKHEGGHLRQFSVTTSRQRFWYQQRD